MAPLAKKAAPAVKTFNFGDMSAYSSGGGMPEGNYAIASVSVEMFAYTKQDGSKAGDERLGALITFRPLAGGQDEVQFYSFGGKAHLSWEPDDTGKKIQAVLGGPGTAPNISTNWAAFIKSMHDSGMPQGTVEDDLSVIEGTHVHIQNQPEPEGRKQFKQAATGEAAMAGGQIEDKPRTVAVVTEILEGGAPWEGGGGVPEEGQAVEAPAKAPAPAKGKVAPIKAAAPKAAAKAAPAPAPVEAEEEEIDIEAAAKAGISEVLSVNEKGCAKLILKTSTFKYVNANYSQEVATKVNETYFSDDKTLGALLEEMGFKLDKGTVKPVA